MATEQKPSIGRIVIYRTKAGIDIAAIVTAVIPEGDGEVTNAVHLQQFPPPGVAPDILSYEWGVAKADDDTFVGRWRWPERV